MSGQRFTRVNALLIGLLMLTLSLPMLAASPRAASAHHENYGYLGSIRSIAQTEQYCVEDLNTYLAFNTALNRVRDTLIVDQPSVNWDLKQGGYTDFRTTWVPCRNLNSSTTPTRSDVEIEYHVEDNITSPGWCGGTSCAYAGGFSWGGPHGRTEWQWYYVKLRSSLIAAGGSATYHVVNHETGHVFGLADGGPTSGSWDTSCPVSIMHTAYYGCGSTLDWPELSTDHATVNRIIWGQP